MYIIDPGAAAIFNNHGSSTITVSKVGGGTLSSTRSIPPMSTIPAAPAGYPLSTLTDGLGTTSEVTLDSAVGGQKIFSFNRSALLSFTMQGVTTQGGWMQFVNVVVDGAGAVP